MLCFSLLLCFLSVVLVRAEQASSQRWADRVSLCRTVSSTELGDLETLCKAVMKEKQPFERLEVSKDTLLKMFEVRAAAHL